MIQLTLQFFVLIGMKGVSHDVRLSVVCHIDVACFS